jgi:uncharacterized membrane protein (Fun14 family)
MLRPMSDHTTRSPDPSASNAARPSIWRSRHLWLALLLTALGAGLWVYRVATTPASPIPERSAGPAASSLTDPSSGLSAGSTLRSDGLSDGSPDAASPPSAPLPFRLGLGFIGGFAIGWALRTFLRITLVIAALIATAIALLRWSGVVELDWGSVEQSVDAGLQQARAAAEAAESRLTRLLPSGLAATYGMWAGWRRG